MQLPRSRTAGFTLAEVAVTIVIVGLGLVVLLQGLNTAKMTAAHTRNMKLASEFARETLGQVASGLFLEELEPGDYLDGTYADEGYPDFTWEILTGDEAFGDPEDDRERFDSFAWDNEDEDEEDEEVEQAYEKVSVRVLFPTITEFSNEYVLMQWIPWDQVYGSDEDEEDDR